MTKDSKLRQGADNHFKNTLMGCTAAVALIAAGVFVSPAMAQDKPAAAPASDGTVVVTGIRKGIQDSISAKKRSSQIVEAVSAEDIGKLPDASIAESIARLPGIAAQRTNGRASTLSIRGLGPDFTVTTLNGREQVSTNDNRSVEFDQFPSELISQVLVYKTPNAAMTEQGLAGTADLRTVRPLEYGKRTISIGLRGEKNSERAAIGGMKNSGNRYNFTYINQFADKTIGLALGYAHTDSPYQTLKKESWGYPNYGPNPSLLITGGEKDAVDSSFLRRDGYMGVLEFKPNDQLHMTFDGYHSDFRELQRIARLEYPLAWGENNLSNPVLGTNYVTSGTFTLSPNVKVVVENYINQRKAKLDSYGWNTEYKANEKWSLMADINGSKVTRDDTLVESTAGTGPKGSGAGDVVKFTQTAQGLTTIQSQTDYSSFSNVFLTDPNGWGGTSPTGSGRAGYVKIPHITDEINAIKLAATRKLASGFLSDVKFGVDFTDHTKKKQGTEGELWLPGNASAQALAVPSQFRTGVTNAQFLGSNTGMISYDSLGLYQSGFFQFTQETCAACLAKTWSVNEKLTHAFLMADVNSSLGGVPVTGNFGLQFQHTKQTATSRFYDGTVTAGVPNTTLITDGRSYSDVLPSVNLNFAVADNTTLRFGAGTAVARPRMDDMAAGKSFNAVVGPTSTDIFGGNPVFWNASGGNSQLKPWKSNNYDLSLEHYFGRKGYVSAAVFYKDITTFIFGQKIAHDFTGVALPSYCTTVICATANANRAGYISGQANGSGGHIQGLELTASLPGELVNPMLDGFGLTASAAFNQSAINPGHLGVIDVPGLSKTVINTTLYYEKYGWSFRISDRYRGDFLGEVPDYTNSLQNTWVRNESVIDAQIGYEFKEGPAKGLTINLSGSNLNNERFWTYAGKGKPLSVLRYEKYGSTYLFGVNYKFQ